MGVKVSSMTNITATSLSNDAEFYVIDSGNQYAISLAELKRAVGTSWAPIGSDSYTATPSSTYQIAMSSTTNMVQGRPIRYTYGNTAYYGIVTSVSENASISIGGATLDTGQQLSLLEYGPYEKSIAIPGVELFIEGTYADGTTTTLLATDMKQYMRFNTIAYLVGFQAVHETADSTTQPKINLLLNGNRVSTEDSGNGLQLGAAGTWMSHSAVAIDTDYYQGSWNSTLEVEVTAAGGTGDAANLTIKPFFVFI